MKNDISSLLRADGVCNDTLNKLQSHSSIISMLESYQVGTEKRKIASTPQVGDVCVPLRDYDRRSVASMCKEKVGKCVPTDTSSQVTIKKHQQYHPIKNQ